MRDYLDHAMHDAGSIELRHQNGDRWESGLFDDTGALRVEIQRRAEHGNLYTTINAPKSIPVSNSMGARALRDADMGYVVRIVFDFDPVRSPGRPSDDDELRLAVQQRNQLVQVLRALGWPMAAIAVSGNGAHAMYRCRISVTGEFIAMLGELYRGLQHDFSTDQVHFDPTVRNPGRVWRLYGTYNRKGSPSADRPHRIAQVNIPSRWEGVSPNTIEKTASRYARQGAPSKSSQAIRPVGKGDFRTLHVVDWFAAHDALKRPLGGGKFAVRCPWAHEHSTLDSSQDTSSVIWEADPGAWPNFHCSHAHCQGRSIREVMKVWGDADAYCAIAWSRSRA